MLWSNNTAISAHQVLLPAPPRNVPIFTRNPQLFACLPRRSLRGTSHVYPACTQAACFSWHLVLTHERFDTYGSHARGCLRMEARLGKGVEGGCLWMGYLANEYPGGGLVRVVARLASWQYPALR